MGSPPRCRGKPGSEDARAGGGVARRGAPRGSIQVTNQQGGKGFQGGVEKIISGALPPLPFGVAPGSKDSGGVRPCLRPPARHRGSMVGQRHKERGDPMEVDSVIRRRIYRWIASC